jgi:hypothetical protein
MVDPSGGAENRVVAGLADVVRTTAQRARGSPLDQYLPWYIGRLSGALSEKFTESLNSYDGSDRVEGKGVSHEKHKKAGKGSGVSLCAFCGYQMLAADLTMYGSLEFSHRNLIHDR